MSNRPKIAPSKGLMIFMWIFKFIVLFEGILLLALTGLYFIGIYGYQNSIMPLTFQPGNIAVPYWPIPSTNSTGAIITSNYSSQSFTYQKSDRSQFVLGAMTVLHALITMLTTCCAGHSLRRAGIFWTIGGLINAITSAITVALTFSENGSSGRQFPNGSPSTANYWIYGDYSIEEWTCGNGKQLVGLQLLANQNQPLGGQDAVNDFHKYCKEAVGAKWVCVLILLSSLFLFAMGIISFCRARSKARSGEFAGPRVSYGDNALPPADKLESFSSGADSDAVPYAEQQPMTTAPPPHANGLHPY